MDRAALRRSRLSPGSSWWLWIPTALSPRSSWWLWIPTARDADSGDRGSGRRTVAATRASTMSVSGAALRCPRLSRSRRWLRIRTAHVPHFECRVGDTGCWRPDWQPARAEAACASTNAGASAAAASDATVAPAARTAVSGGAGHDAAGSTRLHAATVSGCGAAATPHVSAMRGVARTARTGADRSAIANAGHGRAASASWHAWSSTASAADAESRRPAAGRQETALMAYVKTCRIVRVNCATRGRRQTRLRNIGRLRALIYVSDRGGRGRPRTFIHFMRRWPGLACDRSGRQLFIVGGNYRVTPRGIEG